MSRSVIERLRDIVEHLERVLRLSAGRTFDEFVENEAVYQAILFSLGIVGEAVKAVPIEVRQTAPRIDWRNIGRLRDIVFHIYFGLSNETLWEIVQEKAPATLEEFRVLLAKLEESD